MTAEFLDRLRAARELIPPGAMFTLHTAAALHGFGIVGSPQIHITVPMGSAVPQIRGITAHQHGLPITEGVEILGLRCVPAARCAIDLARTLDRPDALAVLDAFLRLGSDDAAPRLGRGDAVLRRDDVAPRRDDVAPRLGRDDAVLRAEAALHDGRRGIRQARELLDLADGRVACRHESRLRLLMHDGGLPPPVPQHEVLDEAGRMRYRVGLAYEEERVGIEYHGQLNRVRRNWLSRRGWFIRYFTDNELEHHSGLIVPTVRGMLRRSRGQTRYSRTSETSLRGAQPWYTP